MAFVPTDTLTIPLGVAIDTSNALIEVFGADLSTEFHDNCGVDASRMRAQSADGLTDLAREVEWYDSATDDGRFHILLPTVSLSGTSFLVGYDDDPAATEPLFTDPIGRNAANALEAASLRFRGDATDSTGNNTFTTIGTGGTLPDYSTVGQVDLAREQFIQDASASGLDAVPAGYTIDLPGNYGPAGGQNAFGGFVELSTDVGGSLADLIRILRPNSNTNIGIGHGPGGGAVNLALLDMGAFIWGQGDVDVTFAWDGSTVYGYTQAVLRDSAAQATVPGDGNGNSLRFGGLMDDGGNYRGLNATLYAARFSKVYKDASRIAFERANRQHQATPFYTVSAPPVSAPSYSIIGDSTIRVDSTGAMSYSVQRDIQGEATILVDSNASLTYTVSNSIVGDTTVLVDTAGGMSYTVVHAIAGDTTWLLDSNGTLDYRVLNSIVGSCTWLFDSAGVMSYQVAGTIVGDTTLLVASEGTMQLTTRYDIAGETTILLESAGTLDYTVGSSITGDMTILVESAADTSYTLSASIAGDTRLIWGIQGQMTYLPPGSGGINLAGAFGDNVNLQSQFGININLSGVLN